MTRKLIRRVAARWALQQGPGDQQPDISPEMERWASERTFIAKFDYVREVEDISGLLHLHKDPTFDPVKTPDEDTFDDAKASVETMLPKILATLGKKFRDKFYMRATQQRLKLYYYFAGHPALENITLSLTLRGGKALLWLAYIPNKLVGGADYAKAIQDQVVVRNPEMAGLAVMRLLRELLAKVP